MSIPTATDNIAANGPAAGGPAANTSAVAGSAVDSLGIDAGVPWHYGDPLREQRALVEGAGLIDRSNRAVLTVSGPDRLSWLHSICSQHVSDLHDGDSTQTLILSPNGHVEQHWQLTELGGHVWLDVEPGMAADALGYLQKMRFLKRVELADLSAEYAVLTLIGPSANDVLARAGLPVPAELEPRQETDIVFGTRAGQVPGLPPIAGAVALAEGGFARWSGDSRIDLLVRRERVAEVRTSLTEAGAELVGTWGLDAWRIVRREPRLRLETDHRTLAPEVGWIGTAVHLEKGCYRGQETVARVQNLGRPPRRLVMLHLGGESDTLPAPGTAVELDGRSIGFIGTTAHHYELGPIALAVIKRSVDDKAVLKVADFTAAID